MTSSDYTLCPDICYPFYMASVVVVAVAVASLGCYLSCYYYQRVVIWNWVDIGRDYSCLNTNWFCFNLSINLNREALFVNIIELVIEFFYNRKLCRHICKLDHRKHIHTPRVAKKDHKWRWYDDYPHLTNINLRNRGLCLNISTTCVHIHSHGVAVQIFSLSASPKTLHNIIIRWTHLIFITLRLRSHWWGEWRWRQQLFDNHRVCECMHRPPPL